MKTTSKIVASRYVGDERDMAFYTVDSSGEIIVMTGSTLSCKFTASGESDINVSVTFANGDGRLHIVVAASQVVAAITWKIMITGTDGAGTDIPPIIGTLTVIEP